MRFLFILVILIFIRDIYGQRVCGTVPNEPILPEQDSALSIAGSMRSSSNPVAGIITIPVVVHVIYNDNPATNISDAQILSQIQVLNEDFRRMWGTRGYNENPLGADLEIEFCLASTDTSGAYSIGIIRKYSNNFSWSEQEEDALRAMSYWPSDRYLNIWVANLPDRVLGKAQFPYAPGIEGLNGYSNPETDGIIIDYQAFGVTGAANAPYNLGRTVTHEVGHWLGLYHLWGISRCGDDYVSDTPWDDKANETGTCSDKSDCDRDGIFTADQTNNYMDYSPDACMNMFTNGQKERIRKVFELSPSRNKLIASQGCLLANVRKQAFNGSVRIFPNPAQDLITVDLLSSYSGEGFLMNSVNEAVKKFSFKDQNQVILDLSDVKSGFYYLILETNQGKLVQKVIRQ